MMVVDGIIICHLIQLFLHIYLMQPCHVTVRDTLLQRIISKEAKK